MMDRTPVRVPPGWTLFVSHSDKPVTRLVVFVHGFRGKGVKTWMSFPHLDATSHGSDWWQGADLLFASYDSIRESITGVACRVRENLSLFYPSPYAPAFEVGGHRARKHVGDYEELILVGHSLGGVIVRRVLADVAQEWVDLGRPDPRPPLLDANQRLFSPASAGFRPAGLLGMLKGAAGVWTAIDIAMRRSANYTDLQQGSTTLVETRLRTERLASAPGLEALKARILWANPDNVVVSERYSTDWVDAAVDSTTHRSVCKPNSDFTRP